MREAKGLWSLGGLAILGLLVGGCNGTSNDPFPVMENPAAPVIDPFFDAVTVRTYPDIALERPMFNASGTRLLGDLRAGSLVGTSSGVIPQIYIADFDPVTGTPGPAKCITCDQPGPNGYAKWSPDGRYILFGSQRNTNSIGRNAGGGFPGDAVWVMEADGSDPVALVPGSTESADFHAVWSHDGTRIYWVHHACLLDCPWVTMVGEFVEKPSPHLENVRPLRETVDGAFYETQDVTPDGRYLLETITAPGLLNGEAFLVDPDNGSIKRRLTHSAYWDEQFHPFPGGNAFVVMSSRDNPGDTGPNQLAAYEAEKPVDEDFRLVITGAGRFNLPNGPRTDLYVVDAEYGDQATGARAIRRLTYLGDEGQVIPEFGISPNGCHIAFGGNRPEGGGVSTFLGLQIVSFESPGCP